MPVNARSIRLQIACHGYFEVIAPIRDYRLHHISILRTQIFVVKLTGPGYWPLISSIGRSNPSGEPVSFVMSRLYFQGQSNLLANIRRYAYFDSFPCTRPFQIHISIDTEFPLPTPSRIGSMSAVT